MHYICITIIIKGIKVESKLMIINVTFIGGLE